MKITKVCLNCNGLGKTKSGPCNCGSGEGCGLHNSTAISMWGPECPACKGKGEVPCPIRFTVLTGKGQLHFEFDPTKLGENERLEKFLIGGEPNEEFALIPMIRRGSHMFYPLDALVPVDAPCSFYDEKV